MATEYLALVALVEAGIIRHISGTSCKLSFCGSTKSLLRIGMGSRRTGILIDWLFVETLAMDFLKAPYCEISRLVVRLGIDMAAVTSVCIIVGLFGT